jgi:hypothetical protein
VLVASIVAEKRFESSLRWNLIFGVVALYEPY